MYAGQKFQAADTVRVGWGLCWSLHNIKVPDSDASSFEMIMPAYFVSMG